MHRVYLSPCACEAETDTGCLHLLLCIRGDSQTQRKREGEGGWAREGKSLRGCSGSSESTDSDESGQYTPIRRASSPDPERERGRRDPCPSSPPPSLSGEGEGEGP
jgi:hypothetical protein